jgi:hypothetical protein
MRNVLKALYIMVNCQMRSGAVLVGLGAARSAPESSVFPLIPIRLFKPNISTFRALKYSRTFFHTHLSAPSKSSHVEILQHPRPPPNLPPLSTLTSPNGRLICSPSSLHRSFSFPLSPLLVLLPVDLISNMPSSMASISRWLRPLKKRASKYTC